MKLDVAQWHALSSLLDQALELEARQATALELLDLGATKIESALNDAPAGGLSRTQVEFDLQVAELALALKDNVRAADVALSVREHIAASELAPYLRGAEARMDDARRALAEARAILARVPQPGPQYTQAVQASARIVAAP